MIRGLSVNINLEFYRSNKLSVGIKQVDAVDEEDPSLF